MIEEANYIKSYFLTYIDFLLLYNVSIMMPYNKLYIIII